MNRRSANHRVAEWSAPGRAAWGAGWGMVLGTIYACFSLFDQSDLPLSRVILSLLAGGAVGGGSYGLLLSRAGTRVRAGAAMGVAASIGAAIVLYGWRFPDWFGLGVLLGIAAGFTYGVLLWRPPGAPTHER